MAASSQQGPAASGVDAPFELHGLRDGDAQIILLAGELDLATVGELTLAIEVAEATSARVIVVDLRMLEFIDCSGVRGILGARRRLRERLRIVGGPPAVQRVFELCGLTERVGFEADRPDQVDPAGARDSRPTRRGQPDSTLGRTSLASRGESRRRASQGVLAGAIRDHRSKPPGADPPGQ